MARFLAKRLLFTFLVLFGALVLVFMLSHSIPADPARAALGQDTTAEALAKYRKDYGLDRPLLVQFGLYLKQLARADFGDSITTGRPVLRDLMELVPATIELLIPSLFASAALGIVLGVVSAVQSGRPADHISRLIAVFGHSVPVFWLGIVLQVIFYKWLGWLPPARRFAIGIPPPRSVTGMYTIDALLEGNLDMFWMSLQYLALPVFTLTMFNLPVIARMTRASMLEVLHTEYVRTARSKGLGERTVVYKHALRNALIPVVTVLGIRIGAALGGAVITETVFSWPGLGRYTVDSLKVLDYPVVIAFTLFMTAAYVLVNLLVDISYVMIDPRIKYE